MKVPIHVLQCYFRNSLVNNALPSGDNKINVVYGNEWNAGNLSYHLKSRPVCEGFVEREKLEREGRYEELKKLQEIYDKLKKGERKTGSAVTREESSSVQAQQFLNREIRLWTRKFF